MTDKPRCSATVFGERVRSWQCNRYGKVRRAGKWYCKQHDPVAEQARRSAADNKYRQLRDEEKAISGEAGRLAHALDVYGYAEMRPFRKPSEIAYSRRLVIPFEDAERLITRLGQSPTVAKEPRSGDLATVPPADDYEVKWATTQFGSLPYWRRKKETDQ